MQGRAIVSRLVTPTFSEIFRDFPAAVFGRLFWSEILQTPENCVKICENIGKMSENMGGNSSKKPNI